MPPSAAFFMAAYSWILVTKRDCKRRHSEGDKKRASIRNLDGISLGSSGHGRGVSAQAAPELHESGVKLTS